MPRRLEELFKSLESRRNSKNFEKNYFTIETF